MPNPDKPELTIEYWIFVEVASLRHFFDRSFQNWSAGFLLRLQPVGLTGRRVELTARREADLLIKWTEYIPSTFDIHDSIFDLPAMPWNRCEANLTIRFINQWLHQPNALCMAGGYSLFYKLRKTGSLFRLDWPLFRPAAPTPDTWHLQFLINKLSVRRN